MKEARKKLGQLQGPKGKKITWRDGSERGTTETRKSFSPNDERNFPQI